MAPVNNYKIQIEQIASSGADKETKTLASTLVKLTAKVEKLARVYEKAQSALSASRSEGRSDVPAAQKAFKVADLLNRSVDELNKVASALNDGVKKLPKEVGAAVEKSSKVISSNPPVSESIRKEVSLFAELLREFKRLRNSESSSDRAILAAIEKIFKVVSTSKGREDADLTKAIRELAVKTGTTRSVDEKTYLSRVLDKLKDGSTKFKKAGDALEDFEKSTSRSTEKVTSTLEDLSKQTRDMSRQIGKTTLEIKNLSQVRSGIEAAVYAERPILPGKGTPRALSPATGIPGLEKTSMMVENLAKSLDNLQKTIVTSLERGMRQGMEIIKNEAGEAFKVAPGERELELNVANVRAIRRAITQEFGQTLPKDIGTRELVTAFKQAYKLSREPITDPRIMANQLIETLGSMNREAVSRMGRNVQKLFEDVQKNRVTTGDVVNRSDLDELHRSIVADAQATKELNKYITRLAVPLVRQTQTGSLAFETKYGSQRVLSNFATVTTGLERLVKELKALGAPSMEVERLSKAVEKAPLTFSRLPGRPHPGGPAEAETKALAQTLLSRVEELGGRKEIEVGYKRAIALRKMETQPGFGKEQARTFMQTSAEFKDLKKQADDLGISALEVAKALDRIDFENFYDVLDRLFKSGKTPFLERQAAEIGVFDRNLRQVSGKVSELLGLMPMMEPGRPKRTAYDEATLRVFTKAVERLRPEEQKRHIVDVDLLWRDIAKRAEQLGEGVFAGKPELGRPVATSLDVGSPGTELEFAL